MQCYLLMGCVTADHIKQVHLHSNYYVSLSVSQCVLLYFSLCLSLSLALAPYPCTNTSRPRKTGKQQTTLPYIHMAPLECALTVFKVDGNNNECWIIEINPISVCLADGISRNPDNRLKFAFVSVYVIHRFGILCIAK